MVDASQRVPPAPPRKYRIQYLNLALKKATDEIHRLGARDKGLEELLFGYLERFIEALEARPKSVLTPPPEAVAGRPGVLEFRPRAPYKGKPSQPITARAQVDERAMTVWVYAIRISPPTHAAKEGS